MRTKIGNVIFNSCIWNASGVWGTTVEEMSRLTDMPPDVCGAVVMKSCTKEPREGNIRPRVFVNNGFHHESLISVGLANRGWDYYIEATKQITDRPIFISEGGLAVGDDLAEFIGKVNDIQRNDILIEFNFSCPNVEGHPQVGYDYSLFQERIDFIRERIQKPWGLKLPPYHDPSQIHTITHSFLIPSVEKGLCFITCCNSMGSGMIVNTIAKKTVIAPNFGVGGIGGYPLKSIALGNVWRFFKILPGEISIIGCGGVSSGVDAMDLILAGASAVEIGTALYDDPRALVKINKTFEDLVMSLSPNNNIDQIRGTLTVEKQIDST